MTTTALTHRACERRFRAMGSDMHVVVVGGAPDLADTAAARIGQLEARWSRFRPDSELHRLNAAAGRPVLVSRDTFLAVDAAVQAWRDTDGRFDPTVLPALVALGYDTDFAQLDGRADDTPPPAEWRAPGCAAIDLNRTVSAVMLPPGTVIDLGGIGKGLAADLVVAELLDAGAAGACVNAGGDVRVAGDAPGDDGWVVAVEHLPDVRLALADGGIATSSSAKRRWTRAGTECHHLVDPRDGRPAATGLRAVTVLAGSAARAEALTKAAFVAGPDAGAALVTAAGATGLLTDTDGNTTALPGLCEFLR